jgi:hypothetical protein
MPQHTPRSKISWLLRGIAQGNEPLLSTRGITIMNSLKSSLFRVFPASCSLDYQRNLFRARVHVRVLVALTTRSKVRGTSEKQRREINAEFQEAAWRLLGSRKAKHTGMNACFQLPLSYHASCPLAESKVNFHHTIRFIAISSRTCPL